MQREEDSFQPVEKYEGREGVERVLREVQRRSRKYLTKRKEEGRPASECDLSCEKCGE